MMKKYIVGIDLGTTNCVLAYSEIEGETPEVKLLSIPQLVAPAVVENRNTLPSFLYLPTEAELQGDAYQISMPPRKSKSGSISAVGEIARKKSADVPDRTISAAKSWLCHSKVDRRQPILPWNAPTEVPKISPLAATCRYLEHLIETWENEFPDDPITEQEIVITVPASFDASARELTREAAITAGFSSDNILFLEEPQAAIYAWLENVGDSWRKNLKVGDTLLVCDVGGGTTDLTLVGVEQEAGDLILKRIAVGDHLLVGGDNMDLALAHHAAELLAEKGTQLDPWQSVALWHSCRSAKESLFSSDCNSDSGNKNVKSVEKKDDKSSGKAEDKSVGKTNDKSADKPGKGKCNAETYPISVLGRGSKLIGGTISVDIVKENAARILADGFFPICELTDKPKRRGMSGFKELGLPFEQDTAITRHLGAFLSAHEATPTHLLLNGGVFKSDSLRTRLFDVLELWFPNRKTEYLQPGAGLDHSVARGAAYYGWMKQQGGVRIRGGTARSYYIGIETAGLAIPGTARPLKALCVAPIGMEEGTAADIPSDEIGLIVGEPAHFRFFSSTVRKQDEPGTVLDSSHITSPNADLQETDSMETILPSSDLEGNPTDDYVPVRFQTNITELGVMELWCNSATSDKRWKLEFSVRED